MKRWYRISSFVLLLLSCRQGPDVLENWTFSVWEDDRPRGWELLAGEVQPAATWHPRDYGVELVSAGTALTQRSEIWFSCLQIDVIADTVAEAEVAFSIDVGDDGVPEEQRVIPASAWAPLSFRAQVGLESKALRITLEKRGEGRAVLANLRVRECD